MGKIMSERTQADIDRELERFKGIDPAKTLSGHISEETAYVVQDYPYGFRLRCQMRHWIETTKNGQRHVTQTSNPKRGGWNAPKKSTYSDLLGLYLDTENYVRGIAWSPAWNDEAGLDRFLELFGADYQGKEWADRILYFRAIKRAQQKITVTIHSAGPGFDAEELKKQNEQVTRAAFRAGLHEVLKEGKSNE